ncbi:hypothetical protein PQR12_36335 [Paraburkholderia nemoris]|uniref:hypothetical protein n=1 Tax=Paraburkholderia nemoris TaxID=2793076 RepID=UPI0038BB0CCD
MKKVSLLRSTTAYFLELAAFYILAYVGICFVDRSKAEFLAGFSLFLVACACLIGRPAAPHMLLKLIARPMILLMAVVVLGFGAFGTREPDLTVFAPGFALVLLGAAFADRIEKSREKKKQRDT